MHEQVKENNCRKSKNRIQMIKIFFQYHPKRYRFAVYRNPHDNILLPDNLVFEKIQECHLCQNMASLEIKYS